MKPTARVTMVPGHRNGRWRPDAVLRRLLAAAVLTVGLTGTARASVPDIWASRRRP
jgi:hypothetical protein